MRESCKAVSAQGDGDENGRAAQHKIRFTWNHKRVYRVYREFELNLRNKPKRRIKRDKPDALDLPAAIHQVWSIDFMSDSPIDGRLLRTLNIFEDYNRERFGIEVELSPTSARITQSQKRTIKRRDKPRAI